MSSFANNAKLNEQHTSSPSNIKKTAHSAVKKTKSLSREFFSQLIKLEADFHNKAYTVLTLDELIQNYAKAVEYYDSIKDEISSYFMFKIQDILATKRSLKMLFDQNRVAARKGTESVAEESLQVPNAQAQQSESPSVQKDIKKEIAEESSGDEDEDMQISKVERKRKARKNIDRNMRVSISLMKNEKQRFFNFYYKMETQKSSEKLNMNVLIDNFEKSADKNDEFIKKDVDHQRERLRKRLEKRVTETFASHQRSSMSPSVSNNAALESWEERRELQQNEMIRQSIIEHWENEGAKIMEVENSDAESDDDHHPGNDSPNKMGEKSPAANNGDEEEDDSPDVL